ncbi:MAG: hypothetical protein M3Y56_02125 [Armatimonadota bacterium]|nr:hypothetical protein [Armatimonadota bacterium]
MKELSPKVATEALIRHFEDIPRDEFIAELRHYWPTLTVAGEDSASIEPVGAPISMMEDSVPETDLSNVSLAGRLFDEVRPLVDPASQSNMDQRLEQALQDIPERYKHVILLRLVESMSCSDIAVVLNISPALAQQMLCRAFAHLWWKIAPGMVDAKDKQLAA